MAPPRNQALLDRAGAALESVIAAEKLARDLRDPTADRSAASELHARVGRAEGALAEPPVDNEAALADALRQVRTAVTPDQLTGALAALRKAVAEYESGTATS